MPEKVLAVILSFNGREDTLACLDSLRRQTRRPDTVLVVDNGSQEPVAPVLAQRFPEARVLRLPENLGYAGGMNAGLRAALDENADFIWALNNDTQADPRCLEQLVIALRDRARAAGVSPLIYFSQPAGKVYFGGGKFTRATLAPVHRHRVPKHDSPRRITFLNACAPLFRASALRSIGLFDERYFTYYEDGDLSLRLTRAGHQLYLVPAAKLWHHHAAAQKTAGQAYAGNVSPIKWYYMTRNRLWLLRRHGSWAQKMLGVPFVLASRLAVMALQVARLRPQKAAAVFRGLMDGFGRIKK